VGKIAFSKGKTTEISFFRQKLFHIFNSFECGKVVLRKIFLNLDIGKMTLSQLRKSTFFGCILTKSKYNAEKAIAHITKVI